MNAGYGPDAESIAKGVIAFVETGFSAAFASAEKLAKVAETATTAMGKLATAMGRGLTAALQAPSRMIDALTGKIYGIANAMANSGLGRLSQMLSFSGGLGIGGLFYAAARGTVEMNQFSVAVRNLVNVMGDQLAPYLRLVTSAIIEMTSWWRGLDIATRRSITGWALVATAIATVIALLPVVIYVVGGIVAAIGTLVAIVTSPWVLMMAAAGAAAVAIGVFFDYISGSSDKAGQNINKSNKSWFSNFLDFVSSGIMGWAKFWNAAMEWGAKAVNFINERLKDAGLAMALLIAKVEHITDPRFNLRTDEQNEAEWQKKKARIMRNRENDSAPLISDDAMRKAQVDIDKLKKGVGEWKNKLEGIGIPPAFKKLFDNLLNLEGPGFGRGQAQWEGFEDTWLRAQRASAETTTGDPAKEGWEEVKKLVRECLEWTGLFKKIADKPAAVQ